MKETKIFLFIATIFFMTGCYNNKMSREDVFGKYTNTYEVGAIHYVQLNSDGTSALVGLLTNKKLRKYLLVQKSLWFLNIKYYCKFTARMLLVTTPTTAKINLNENL